MADEAIIVGVKDNATGAIGAINEQLDVLSQAVRELGEETEKSTESWIANFTAIGAAAATVAAGWVALKFAQELYASSVAALESFNAQQESIDGLRHSLARYVDDVDSALAKQLEFASSLQDFAGIGDESTIALQRQAAQMGYSEEQIESLIATAAGLKGEFGLGYEQAFNLAVQATERNSSALSDLIPEMRLAYTEAQRFEMVQQAAARGMEALADETNTTRGELARAQSYWGDLSETLGSIVAPVFETIAKAGGEFAKTMGEELAPVVEFVTGLFEASSPVIDAIIEAYHNAAVILGTGFDAAINVLQVFGEWLGITGQAAEGWGEALSSVIDWASRNVIAAITWLEVILSNLPAVFELVSAAAEYAFIWIVEEAKHAFTVRIPAFLEHFGLISGSTFKMYLETAGAVSNGLLSVFSASYSALADLTQVTFELIAESMNLAKEIMRGIYLDYQLTVMQLPEVADREITAREAELLETMGRIGTNLGEEFSGKFEERVARLGVEAREDMTKDWQKEVKDLKQRLPRIGVDATQLNAVEARFLTRGKTDDPLVSIEANTLRAARSLEDLPADLAAALERQADRRADGSVIRLVPQ